ncbi:uncharacterized protein PHALS_02938 [Plasmopara halstedii]|uniref:Uncharacterized protein n=1 Tax=Plasmopara halstedii TaxID=4781 RepID=A0A0P1AVZ1_PLAHL|nr:uncharacterized protein PHALS_02938 [Plasmopara halstedii]CEG46538.1 hypothetical protein PHALS_02938 [Plasmopara halstedii]|eukprot:XP_024582907.1 hypothetical protein PHALS_02938 [Plasmopara halstedii]
MAVCTSQTAYWRLTCQVSTVFGGVSTAEQLEKAAAIELYVEISKRQNPSILATLRFFCRKTYTSHTRLSTHRQVLESPPPSFLLIDPSRFDVDKFRA